MALLGGIEAGGTKFVCAVGTGPDDIRATIRIPTTTPEETLAKVVAFFYQQTEQLGTLDAIGIGAFGPVDVREKSSTFGWFLDTPKPAWQQIDNLGVIKRAFNIPVGFDTDVNAAALGEHQWGNAQGLETFIYLTVGTGVGGGGMVGGQPIHGLLHPEMGHIVVPHDLSVDPFPGCCPFHKDCLEGLASGVAMEKRWGTKGINLPEDHPAWALEASYLAAGLVNFILILAPERIIMGGGVMEQKQLFPMIRTQVQEKLNGYLRVSQITDSIEDYILPPQLGGKAGILGSFALAKRVLATPGQ